MENARPRVTLPLSKLSVIAALSGATGGVSVCRKKVILPLGLHALIAEINECLCVCVHMYFLKKHVCVCMCVYVCGNILGGA